MQVLILKLSKSFYSENDLLFHVHKSWLSTSYYWICAPCSTPTKRISRNYMVVNILGLNSLQGCLGANQIQVNLSFLGLKISNELKKCHLFTKSGNHVRQPNFPLFLPNQYIYVMAKIRIMTSDFLHSQEPSNSNRSTFFPSGSA